MPTHRMYTTEEEAKEPARKVAEANFGGSFSIHKGCVVEDARWDTKDRLGPCLVITYSRPNDGDDKPRKGHKAKPAPQRKATQAVEGG